MSFFEKDIKQEISDEIDLIDEYDVARDEVKRSRKELFSYKEKCRGFIGDESYFRHQYEDLKTDLKRLREIKSKYFSALKNLRKIENTLRGDAGDFVW